MTELARLVLLAMVGLAGALAAGAASAGPVETRGATTCDIGAFATDHNPKGTDIRAAPRADAPVIGHLPPLFYLSKDDYTGVEFRMIGAKNGWLLIEKARYENTLEYNFEGPGWIPGSLAALQIGDERLFAAPRADAPILVWLMDGVRGWGGTAFTITQIHSCQGKFAEITVQPPEKNLKTRRGWVSGTCTAQLTTCDSPYSADVHRLENYRYPEE